jgi:tetratricopeptide (TPR) repeat protein
MILLTGCGGFPNAPLGVKFPSRMNLLSERYQMKALEYEKSGELQRALFNWKVVAELNPGDRQFAEKIIDLIAAIESKGEEHFKKGVASYKNGSFEAARKEFLIALRYNPNHKEALDYLKNKLTAESYTVYEVKRGDTLKDIAREVYKDPGKDFLIAYFIDIDTKEKPLPGTSLKLPMLEASLTRRLVDIEKELLKAKNLLRDKDYEKILHIAGKVLEYDPKNKDAADLVNVSYYQIGTRLILDKKYREALNMFNRVAPGYNGVKEAISDVNKIIEKDAEIYYREGVKHFLNEELEEAINEWEKTLVLNPEHQKAKRDIENARGLLEKLKQIK